MKIKRYLLCITALLLLVAFCSCNYINSRPDNDDNQKPNNSDKSDGGDNNGNNDNDGGDNIDDNNNDNDNDVDDDGNGGDNNNGDNDDDETEIKTPAFNGRDPAANDKKWF